MASKKRLRMRDWLTENLDSGCFSGTLDWIKGEEEEGGGGGGPPGRRRLFRVKWLHASTVNYTKDDSNLFEEWCRHTGKLKECGDSAKRWKANFRCALNSLPDVLQLNDMTVRKGKNAYRVFEMLDEKLPEKVAKKKESNLKFTSRKLLKRRRPSSRSCEPQGQTCSRRGPVTLRIKRTSSCDYSVETPTDDSLPESAGDCQSLPESTGDCNDETGSSAGVPASACYTELPLTVVHINFASCLDDRLLLTASTTSPAAGDMSRHFIDRGFATEQERTADFNQDSASSQTSSMGDSSEELLNDVNDIVSSDLHHSDLLPSVCSQRILHPATNNGFSRDQYAVHQGSANVVVRSNFPIGNDDLGMLACQQEDLDTLHALV